MVRVYLFWNRKYKKNFKSTKEALNDPIVKKYISYNKKAGIKPLYRKFKDKDGVYLKI